MLPAARPDHRANRSSGMLRDAVPAWEELQGDCFCDCVQLLPERERENEPAPVQ